MTRPSRAALHAGVWALALTGMAPSQAGAQSISTQVFDTVVPFTYNRGRNESVMDRVRPEYDPIGVNLGGFTLLPTLSVNGGYTNNVYQSSTFKVDAATVTVVPRVLLRSNWAVHGLSLDANGNFVRYLGQSARNEDGWSVGGQGRLDIGPDQSLNIGARTSRLYETPFSGTGVPVARSALPTQASIFKALADFKFARTRLVLSADHSRYNYLSAETFAGTRLTRDTFDRHITRFTGHGEYGLTPDAGLFLQGTYSDTSYRLPLSPGIANRDSSEVQLLGGVSLDVTALVRGSLAVGYIDRSYNSPLYRDIQGLSVSGKIEYFPSELTTFTLAVRRDIEDATLTGTSGFFNNGIAARLDHELLRNLILNFGVDYEHDSYRGVTATADIARTSAGGRYILSPAMVLDTSLSYRKRSTNAALIIGPNISEFRATFGITIRR